jgi:hypothetical protein
VLAVAAATADGTTRIYNAERLRIKESDRLAAMCDCLSRIGADIAEEPGGLIIRGVPALRGGTVSGYNDHRIAMAMTVASIVSEGPVIIEGAEAIDRLGPDSKVLIAEACTHAPLAEDIGRVKIPARLRARYGEGISISMVSGTDFPEDLTQYDLIIHCGACMFNRKHVLNRIAAAEAAGVPITNYGIVLAELAGILNKIEIPG